MTQDELNKVTQDVIAELKKNGTNIADASVVSDISQVNNLVAYGKNGKVIKVTPRTIQESVVKHVAWNDSSRLNDFTTAGVYEITGERKMSKEYDNLPIDNSGSGHTISARLEVFDSSINDTTNSDDKCITQKLTLSNRVGGDGNVYIRTGRGRTYDSITWEKWGTLQTNINVGRVGSLDEFVDNGIYSGVWTDGSSFAQTFVMVVINDYAIAGDNKTIVQYKYAYDTLKGNGEPTYNTRSLHNGVWSDWEDTQVDDDLDVLKEELLTAININKENIANNSIAIGEEEYRAIKAETRLQKDIDKTNNIVGIEEKKKLSVYGGAVLEDGSTYSTPYSAYTEGFKGGDIAITNNGYYISNARKVSVDGVAEMVAVNSKRLRTEKGYTYQLNISKDGNGEFSNDELKGIVGLYNYDSSEIEKNKTDIQYLFEEAVKLDGFEVEELGDGIGINFDTFNGHGSSIEIPFATKEKAGVMSANDKQNLYNLLSFLLSSASSAEELEEVSFEGEDGDKYASITPDGIKTKALKILQYSKEIDILDFISSRNPRLVPGEGVSIQEQEDGTQKISAKTIEEEFTEEDEESIVITDSEDNELARFDKEGFISKSIKLYRGDSLTDISDSVGIYPCKLFQGNRNTADGGIVNNNLRICTELIPFNSTYELSKGYKVSSTTLFTINKDYIGTSNSDYDGQARYCSLTIGKLDDSPITIDENPFEWFSTGLYGQVRLLSEKSNNSLAEKIGDISTQNCLPYICFDRSSDEKHNYYRLNIAVATDFHTHTNAFKNVCLWTNDSLIKEALSMIICSGDWQNNGSGMTFDKFRQTCRLIRKAMSLTDTPILFCQGNHDKCWENNTVEGLLPNQNLREWLYNPMYERLSQEDKNNFKWGNTTNCLYYSLKKTFSSGGKVLNVKYIAVDEYELPILEGTKGLKYNATGGVGDNPFSTYISKEQMQFIVDELTSAEDSDLVIIFKHTPTGDRSLAGSNDALAGIIKAYNEKTNGSVTVNGLEDIGAYSITFDFSENTESHILLITGHTHNSELKFDEVYGCYKMVGCATSWYGGDLVKCENSITETNCDIASIHPSSKELYTIKYGVAKKANGEREGWFNLDNPIKL